MGQTHITDTHTANKIYVVYMITSSTALQSRELLGILAHWPSLSRGCTPNILTLLSI